MVYKRISIERIERRRHSDGSIVNFWLCGSGGRRNVGCSLGPEEVPEFEGDVAYFRCMWHRKGPWMGWTLLKQVEPPDRQLSGCDHLA
jgi:hypothetical protein